MDDLKCTEKLQDFIHFYDQASIEQADLTRRLELWMNHYNFPHVPPGYKKYQLAREILEYGWSKYPFVYDKIKYFELTPSYWQRRLQEAKEILSVDDPVAIHLLFFVAAFETDPFILKENEERYMICFPTELPAIDFRLTQELARTIHAQTSGMAPSHTRTLAQLIFQEGVSLHTAHQLLDEEKRNEAFPFFHNDGCTREPNRIIMNILPHLNRRDYEALYSFTNGKGASGFEKEANYTGWNLVQYLLDQGVPLNELVSIQAEDVDVFVERTLYSILNSAYTPQPQE
ncbi:hypothetical protein LCM20_03760 [Halobacillus litoralis]|uniref:hypothetical protein n=1 Tax=Halobacillus litoralis TaxID=45668 RepID=UPI001CD2A1F0|nr:hypothetical protein [Halobacillus litoralis]MCA0969709.1 hypothetical protein [Halobacillus litoralis]